MGNKQNTLKLSETDEIERMVLSTYKNCDINFSYKEVITIKLRFEDAKKYFHTTFDYFLYFNSYIFKERLSTLYDNFSSVVEKFSKISNKPLFMLIDFDDEIDINNYDEIPQKIDYESLFTIIFEALELKAIKFFLMTNLGEETLPNFFEQLYENIYVYKTNRHFFVMYFLLPNLDILIRDGQYLLYIVNQPNSFDESLNMLSDYTISYSKGYLDEIFLALHFKDFFIGNNIVNETNKYIYKFLPELIPGPELFKSLFSFNLGIEDELTFIEKYEDKFKLMEVLLNTSKVNIILIYLELEEEQINLLNLNIFKLVLRKILNMFNKCTFFKSSLVVKFYFVGDKKFYSKESFEELNKTANELVSSLITDSFILSNKEKLRKIIIEFYQNFPLKESDLLELQSISENAQIKKNIVVQMYKWKIYYLWFFNQKYIKKMKNKIYHLLYDKIDDNKSFHHIFQFLFNDKYYIHRISFEEGKYPVTDTEKLFYI